MKRFHILDALRAVLALCVAIGHGGAPPLLGPVGQPDQMMDFLARAWRTTVFGPPAVIAFFVISGFCIHYPFAAHNQSCAVGRFYARRYLRILVPVISVIVLTRLAFPSTVIFGRGTILWNSVLWSIACEEIYYAAYPALNRLGRTFGWLQLVIMACVPAILVCYYYFPAVNWEDIGLVATATTLFPVWLAGCYLADTVDADERQYSQRSIWFIRFGTWLVMWAELVLHFHSVIHQTASGLLVGIACFFWVRAEIRYYRSRKPWQWLVWAGRWSYSLYLVHFLVIGICATYGLNPQTSMAQWLTVFVLILTTSYLFYLVIEKPSHNLARKIPLFAKAVPRSPSDDGFLIPKPVGDV